MDITVRRQERSGLHAWAQKIIRYGAYPAVAGGSFAALVTTRGQDHAALWMLGIVALAIGLVALFERIAPFHPEWTEDHDDFRVDLIYNLFNLTLIASVGALLAAFRANFELPSVWPTTWPFALQLLAAGTILDAGLYAMHRLSHVVPWLWRLHAPHHSPERLYFLNGERRHLLHALLLAGPGLIAVTLLGAPSDVVGTWFAFLAVHLAFQHANIDYTVGPLRGVLGVAETHRWHHKREYEDAQVNFGEFWIVFDRLFGSYHGSPKIIGAGELGLTDRQFPRSFLGQLAWPFRRAHTVPVYSSGAQRWAGDRSHPEGLDSQRPRSNA